MTILCVKIRFFTSLYLKFNRCRLIISTNVNFTLSNAETAISYVIFAFSNYDVFTCLEMQNLHLVKCNAKIKCSYFKN